MTQEDISDLQRWFVQSAVEYYFVGRFAAINAAMPMAGNLLHHAVEMLLKAMLLPTTSVEDLKSGFGHSLPKLYGAVRKLHAHFDTPQFCGTVDELHRFEAIRYPDAVAGKSILMVMSPFRPPSHAKRSVAKPAVPTVKQHWIVLADIDELFRTLHEATETNPEYFTECLSESAKTALYHLNSHAKYWSGTTSSG